MAGVCTGDGPCVTTPTGTGNNWVTRAGGLPDYVRALVNAFKRKGVPESVAVQRAIGVLQNWASGRGNVTAETRARAAKAIAEWEALKAKAHADLTASSSECVEPFAEIPPMVRVLDLTPFERGLTAALREVFPRLRRVDLAADPVFATTDGPNLTVAAGPHRYHHGWVRIDAAAPSAVERATRAVATDGHALLHGAGMVPAAQQVIERAKAAGHRVSVKRVDVAGTPHLHVAKTGGADLTAPDAATVDLAFTEALHPRAPKGSAGGGRFAPRSASGSAPPSNMAANVRDFQRRNKLPVTGVVDTATAAKIRAELAAKGGSGKSKARKAAATAKRRVKAATAAQKRSVATHVATVNAMTPPQRAVARAQVPIPPTGYVWAPDNTLRRFHG